MAMRGNLLTWGMVVLLAAMFAGAVVLQLGWLGEGQTWAALPGVDGNEWVSRLTFWAIAASTIGAVLRPLSRPLFLHLLKVSGLLALLSSLAAFTGLGYVGGGVILLAVGVLVGIALLGFRTSERRWKVVWGVLATEGCLLLGGLLLLFTRGAGD